MMLVDCFDGVPLFFVGFVFVKGQSTQLECTFAAQKKKTFKTQNFYLPPNYFIISFNVWHIFITNLTWIIL